MTPLPYDGYEADIEAVEAAAADAGNPFLPASVRTALPAMARLLSAHSVALGFEAASLNKTADVNTGASM
jgi:hypothetical protein